MTTIDRQIGDASALMKQEWVKIINGQEQCEQDKFY